MKTNQSSLLFPLLASLCVGFAVPACTSGDGAAGKDGGNGKDGVNGKDGAIGATGKDGKSANSDDGLTCKPALGELNGGGTLGEIQPAPPSVGADVPVTYFGPAPSSVNGCGSFVTAENHAEFPYLTRRRRGFGIGSGTSPSA